MFIFPVQLTTSRIGNLTRLIHTLLYVMTIHTYIPLLLFLTFSVLVANPKKLLYTVANPARGLLNREKRTKEKVWEHTPPPHPPHCSFGENKKNHATHLQALRSSWSVSRPYKDTFGSSTRPMGVASQNSTLPSAIIRFPVSLLLSSPGDV